MSKRGKALLAAGLFLLFMAAISLSNLRRPRPGPQEAAFSGLSARAPAAALLYTRQDSAGMVQSNSPVDNAGTIPDRRLIRNAELGLTVVDARMAADQIRKITEARGGEVDNLEVNESEGSVSVTLLARVPASGLVTALTDYKKLAVRTDHEQVSGRDVTREFYDNEAHLRNLRAEEAQYLTIMKQARTIADILAVTEKLSDVRDRIERLQTQIQVMTRNIEMSAVSTILTQESDTRVLGIRWRPQYSARIAIREMLAGLGDWVDWVIAVLIKLPLILLWAVTVAVLLWVAWKVGRAAWVRFVMPKNTGKAQ